LKTSIQESQNQRKKYQKAKKFLFTEFWGSYNFQLSYGFLSEWRNCQKTTTQSI
jgi:hypothetical protein